MFKTIITTLTLFIVINKASAQHTADSTTIAKISLINSGPSRSFNLQLPPQPSHFYTQKLPLFCSMEWKLEKTTRIPFRFRLGSVEYCDRMEGKNR